MCKKKYYKSKKNAKKSAKRQSKGKLLRAYFCGICGYFHLTSKIGMDIKTHWREVFRRSGK